jgi:hypothetical protein
MLQRIIKLRCNGSFCISGVHAAQLGQESKHVSACYMGIDVAADEIPMSDFESCTADK